MKRRAGFKGAIKKLLEVLGVIFILIVALGAYAVYEESKTPSGKVYTQKEVFQNWANARVKFALENEIVLNYTVYKDTAEPGRFNPQLDRAVSVGQGWEFLNDTAHRFGLLQFGYVPNLAPGSKYKPSALKKFTAKNFYDELVSLVKVQGLPLNATFVLEPFGGEGGYYAVVSVHLERGWGG
ncbi:hypothetical protein JCM16307_08970 [Thermococcus prieurii]